MRGLGIILLLCGLLLGVFSGVLSDAPSEATVSVGEDANAILEDLMDGTLDTNPNGSPMAPNPEAIEVYAKGIEFYNTLETIGWITAALGAILLVVGCIRNAAQTKEYDY